MLIFKMISLLATALVAFAIGTGIVAGATYLSETPFSPGQPTSQAAESKVPSGIYFSAPSINKLTNSNCDLSGGEIRPFGWSYDLPASQIPPISRMARDGHWFFFETKTDVGRSFEFFGIIPDSAGKVSGKNEITIQGKLLRLANGEVTGNVDATYLAPACIFQ